MADSLIEVMEENQALSGQSSDLSNIVEKGKQLVIAQSTATAVKIQTERS